MLPNGTGQQDKTTYNHADQIMKITMGINGVKALASLAYARDNNGQVKTTITVGLPGEEKGTAVYDANSRLTSATPTSYEYDPANNPTKIGGTTNTYDAADELETSATTSYGYDQLGERTTRTPKPGQATTYGYDQAGNLIQIKQGKLGGLNNTYAYNGDGLRTSQTKAKANTSYLTWDIHAHLPLVLSDEQNSYIYGPGGLPIEQISKSFSTVYIHHDQQGSTRLLTGTTGKPEAITTYDAYGNTTGSQGVATTPLGYDGQYTTPDTGLIYLRARTYDPTTAQFLSTDPLTRTSHTPYTYAAENPLNYADPTGQDFIPIPIEFCVDGPEAAAGCALLGAGAAIGAAIFGEEAAENLTRSVEQEGSSEEAAENEADCSAEIPTYDNPNRNPEQDKKLSPSEIEKLRGQGLTLTTSRAEPVQISIRTARVTCMRSQKMAVVQASLSGSTSTCYKSRLIHVNEGVTSPRLDIPDHQRRLLRSGCCVGSTWH